MKMLLQLALLFSLTCIVCLCAVSAQQPPEHRSLKPFTAETNFMSIPGYLHWQTFVKEQARMTRKQTIFAAIDRAMQYVKGKESQGLPQYNDNIVDFCMMMVKTFPQYQGILDDYRKWILANDTFIDGYPYWSIRHVLSLGSIGADEKAKEIFARIKHFSNGGKWQTSYHIGFYLYGCLVDNDPVLLARTLDYLTDTVVKQPDQLHYFTAYCVWKAYERTKDDKYRKLFVTIVNTLKSFSPSYIDMAATDGHMGEALCVFAIAYTLTKDEDFRILSGKLVDVLLKSQAKDGSWNDFAGYAIMPAAGMTLYLNIL